MRVVCVRTYSGVVARVLRGHEIADRYQWALCDDPIERRCNLFDCASQHTGRHAPDQCDVRPSADLVEATALSNSAVWSRS